MQGVDSFGYGTLRQHYSQICAAPLDPAALGDHLYSLALVSSNVRENALLCPRKDDQLRTLLDAVMRQGRSGAFQQFVQAIIDDEANSWLGERLKESYVSRGGRWIESDREERAVISINRSGDREDSRPTIVMNNVREPKLDLKVDLFTVRCALLPVASRWAELALCLGVDYSCIEEIKARHGGVVGKCVTEVAVSWLRGGGRKQPSWKQLIEVISKEMGGNNPAYAEQVASYTFLEGVPDFCSRVDDKSLDMGSSSEVQRSLEQVASSWMEMGICFGVGYDLLEPLDRADVKGSLRTVVQLWLGRRYDSALFGEPSWRKLVEVVGWRCGACNPPLAESIAKEHQMATPMAPPPSQPSPAPQQQHEQSGKKHQLTLDDLDPLFEYIQGAHLHWKDLGRKLQMTHAETTSIVSTPGLTQTKDYLQELLMRWLKWAPPIHPFPTTEDLAEALRGVGSENIAYKLTKHNGFMSGSRLV